jgi:hypothetical protein
MPEQLSIGKHRLRVTGSALVEKEGGDPTVQVYVQDTENADEIGTLYLSTSEAAWEWTEKKLTVLGWEPKANDYRFDYLNAEGEENPLRGAEFDANVSERTYMGNDNKERTGIRIDFVSLGGFAERMPPEKATAFAKQLRQRLIASKGQQTASAPKQKPPPARPKGGPSKEVEDANRDVWGPGT